MKILKYFFYSLLILFLLFIGTGILIPELSYEAEIQVDSTPARCWEVFTDTTKMSEWVLNFESIRVIDKSPEVIGSTYELKVMDSGTEYIMTETVTAYNPGGYYAFRIENDVLTNDVDFSFENESGKTRILTSNKVVGKGILMKSIFPFMKSIFVKQAEGDLQKLKHLIENK